MKKGKLRNEGFGKRERTEDEVNKNMGVSRDEKHSYVDGPQISFSKVYLTMNPLINETAEDSVFVTNNGSTAIYYEWRKVLRPDYIESKHSDPIHRFYCHYPRNILLPAQTKKFVFSFRSTSSGSFYEEWEMLTDPALTYPISCLHLNGMAIDYDYDQPLRDDIVFNLEENSKLYLAKEIVGDVVNGVRTPTPPPLDMGDPEVFRIFFEKENIKLRLIYSLPIMEKFRNLLEYVSQLVGRDCDYSITSVQTIKEFANEIEDSALRKKVLFQIQQFIYEAKEPVYEECESYEKIKSALLELFTKVPEISDRIRQEKQLPDQIFEIQTERSEDDQKKPDEEKKAAKPAAKGGAGKKKGKTEEEEKKDEEDYKIELEDELSENLSSALKLKRQLKLDVTKLEKMDLTLYEKLSRKQRLEWVDLEGKVVLLRLDLDVPLSKIEIETVVVPADKDPLRPSVLPPQGASPAKGSLSKRNSTALKRKGTKDETSMLEEKRIKERTVLDFTDVDKAVKTLMYLVDHLCDRIIVLASLGDQHGKECKTQSMKPVAEAFKTKIDQEVLFYQQTLIEDFHEKLETEEIPTNAILVLQNLNFVPEEIGFSYDKNTGECEIVQYEDIDKFAEELSSYGSIFINEALKDSLIPTTSITSLNSRQVVMGKRMGEEVNKISTFFINKNTPSLAIIGGNLSNVQDKLLLIYSLLDTCQTIQIVGYLALYIIKSINICDIPLENYCDKYKDILKSIIHKAFDLNVKIILPTDLKIGQFVEPSMEEERKVSGSQDGEDTEELKDTVDAQLPQKDFPISGFAAKTPEPEESWVNQIYENSRELEIINFEIVEWYLEEEKEWERKRLEEEEFEKERLRKEEEEKEEERLAATAKKGAKQPAKKEVGKTQDISELPTPKASVAPSIAPLINERERILEFGSETISSLLGSISEAKKILWDGEPSLYPETKATTLTMILIDALREKNKANLLGLNTPSKLKPINKPLIMLHDPQTQNSISTADKYTKEQLKFHKRRAIIQEKRAIALAQDEEFDENDVSFEEEEEEEELESKAFQFDTIADFTAFEGDFTLRLMQGVDIPGLNHIGEKDKPTQEEVEEDLAILEEI